MLEHSKFYEIFHGCYMFIYVIWEETRNSFKIAAAGIDINQCEYNYFSHVKHTDIVYVLVCR